MRKNLTGSSIKVGSFAFPLLFRILRILLPGHYILPCQSVGHFLLFAEPGELQKFLLWGRLLRTIQWSRWWWARRFNVDVGIFK